MMMMIIKNSFKNKNKNKNEIIIEGRERWEEAMKYFSLSINKGFQFERDERDRTIESYVIV